MNLHEFSIDTISGSTEQPSTFDLETEIFDCIIQQRKVKPWVTKTLDDAPHSGFLLEAGSEPGYLHNTRKCNFTDKAFNRNATLGPSNVQQLHIK